MGDGGKEGRMGSWIGLWRMKEGSVKVRSWVLDESWRSAERPQVDAASSNTC